MHRRWFVKKTNPEYIRYLSASASISSVLAQILINRGLKTPEAVSDFLDPSLSQLSDPFEMHDVKKATERILTASRTGEKVLVHGDYDADGLTATAIMIQALKTLGVESSYFIPNRMEHGYGFQPSSVPIAKKIGATLIITVDCGITSFDATALCKKEGIDVIITDHHEPVRNRLQDTGSRTQVKNHASCIMHHASFDLPDTLAVINPKISRPDSPCTHLSGAGIALKLAHALLTTYGIRDDSSFLADELLDLAALGTMADVVPLTGENRIIVREGLKCINNGNRVGIQTLMNVAGISGKPLRTGLLLFTIIPRINAAGRISDANKVLDLFLTNSEDEAAELSSWLDKLNSERQRIEEDVYQHALSLLDKKEVGNVIVLACEGWHKGVIGIVASRLAEAFYRPTFILTKEGDITRGSSRSIPSFDLYRALTRCESFLNTFGGHKQAAGLELETMQIQPFEEYINRIAEEMLASEDFIPLLEIDADVDLSHINVPLTREFEMLEPFGFGNSEPVLGSKGLEVLYPRIVKNSHLKMKLRQKSLTLDAIGFDMASFFDMLEASSTVDAAFTPLINEWNGNRNLQLNLKALRPSLS